MFLRSFLNRKNSLPRITRVSDPSSSVPLFKKQAFSSALSSNSPMSISISDSDLTTTSTSTPTLAPNPMETATTHIESKVSHGPFNNWLYNSNSGESTVVGYCKYPSVRKAFEENFALQLEDVGSQLVVYEGNEKIIDLYGYTNNHSRGTTCSDIGKHYDGDTLQSVYSSGKNIEAISIAMLIDRGLIDSYSDKVTKYWPEFGQQGKDHITIKDVLRHEGGVPFTIDPTSVKDDDGDALINFDVMKVSEDDIEHVVGIESKIENSPMFPRAGSTMKKFHNTQRCYHTVTRGFLINGIIRRVDPKRRTIGQFVAEEIVNPINEHLEENSKDKKEQSVKYFCGIPQQEQSNHVFANMTLGSILYFMIFTLIPAYYGSSACKEIAIQIGLATKKDSVSKAALQCFPMMEKPNKEGVNFSDTPYGKSLEISSAGIYTNARSMAKINTVMTNGGRVAGTSDTYRLLSEEAVEQSMSDIKTDIDLLIETTMGFSQGGFARIVPDAFQDNSRPSILHPDDELAFDGFLGWGGAGGSISMWHPSKRISFAYVMNGMGFNFGGPRSRRIMCELQKCINEKQ